MCEKSCHQLEKINRDEDVLAKVLHSPAYCQKQSDFPTCICLDDFHDLIFILDSGNNQIHMYVSEPGLIFRQVINIGSTCELQICGLASDSGYLYTLHQGSNCINIFTSTGEYITNYKFKHMQAREISRPIGIVINEDGYAIIAGFYGETSLYSLYWHVHWTSYLAVVDLSQTNTRLHVHVYEAEEVKGIATDKKGTLYAYMYVCGRTTVYRHSYLKKEQQCPTLHTHTHVLQQIQTHTGLSVISTLQNYNISTLPEFHVHANTQK